LIEPETTPVAFPLSPVADEPESLSGKEAAFPSSDDVPVSQACLSSPTSDDAASQNTLLAPVTPPPTTQGVTFSASVNTQEGFEGFGVGGAVIVAVLDHGLAREDTQFLGLLPAVAPGDQVEHYLILCRPHGASWDPPDREDPVQQSALPRHDPRCARVEDDQVAGERWGTLSTPWM